MRCATPLRLGAAALSVALGAAVLAGCAPEPNEVPKDHAKDSHSSWPETTVEDEKTTTLPESFPSDEVKLPADAKIDNAGTRGDSTWFVALRADDLAAAKQLRDRIAQDSGFEVDGDPQETGDGGEQQGYLTASYFVSSLTQQDGDTALLSLDIDRATG